MSQYKFLLEACGSLTSSYLIKAVKNAGAQAVASDITECWAQHVADGFIKFPPCNDPKLWTFVEQAVARHQINVVIPSFDETLLDWAKKKDFFIKRGTYVILSDEDSIKLCQDKWETFLFFRKNKIPTPNTSLEYQYDLVKPRLGRGGKGILIKPDPSEVNMQGMISQEYLTGQEFTIDVFCDNLGKPSYIIPRQRLQVKDGKSINGITVNNPKMISWVKKICEATRFIGPINIQCFQDNDGDIKFTEINPRVAGGMALGFAASENWISLIIRNIIEKESFNTKPVKYGLKMFRTYDELFIS